MPHLFPFASHGNEEALQEIVDDLPPKQSRRSALLRNFAGFWRRRQDHPELDLADHSQREDYCQVRRPSLPEANAPFAERCAPPRAIPSLPRALTLLRQESEQRDKLLEVPFCLSERRAVSLDRRRSASSGKRPFSPRPVPLPSVSAPDIVESEQQVFNTGEAPSDKDAAKSTRNAPEQPPSQDRVESEVENADDEEDREIDQSSLQEEYDRRWILNLSMHFRDKSNREKFFVTYAETPNKWRRLTISLDYRNAPPDSLEADLSTLHFQRDKSFRIYEAIRESLPEIQYYDTVTNLKLETSPEDDQLHVHVREDANEIIHYPATSLFEHVRVRMYPESELDFISHLSGFVYKVQVEESTFIKKEIPGPDTVDEFLYEVNALHALLGCRHVIQLEGLVTDESGTVVKGLLISYASQGALVDMLFDLRGSAQLPWHRREKWAKQIVQGLSDIHEAGFVQGDFTLSNIVIDEDDDVQIIDINRRGCPVGWEPPELALLIDSGQRIGMCISVKTDLFQLGMVLWALAEEIDEPERIERPLPRLIDSAPRYFSEMVTTCISSRPQARWSARRLLRHFPPMAGLPPSPSRPSVGFEDDVRLSDHSVSTHRSDKEYIDPDMAVTLEDVNPRHRRYGANLSPISSGQVQYVDPQDPDSNPASSSYQFGSTGSWVVPLRGRSPVSSRRGRNSPFARTQSSSATSLSRSPPSRRQRRRGSDCSPAVDERETPTIEITADEKPAPQARRVAALQGEAPGHESQLLHTDSGFDEHMDGIADSGPSNSSSTHSYPFRFSDNDPQHPPPSSQNDSLNTEKDSLLTPNIPSPGSFYTPLESSNDPFSKGLGIELHDDETKNVVNTIQDYEIRQITSDDGMTEQQDVQARLGGNHSDELEGTRAVS